MFVPGVGVHSGGPDGAAHPHAANQTAAVRAEDRDMDTGMNRSARTDNGLIGRIGTVRRGKLRQPAVRGKSGEVGYGFDFGPFISIARRDRLRWRPTVMPSPGEGPRTINHLDQNDPATRRSDVGRNGDLGKREPAGLPLRLVALVTCPSAPERMRFGAPSSQAEKLDSQAVAWEHAVPDGNRIVRRTAP